MKKMKFFNFVLTIQFLISHSFLLGYYTNQYNTYYQYNQPSPFNQNYYDPQQFVYPNRTEAEKLLSAKVEKAFQDDPNLSPYASSIQVYSIGNEVTLSGLIDSDRIKLRAESKAKSVLGVKKVINSINVEKTR